MPTRIHAMDTVRAAEAIALFRGDLKDFVTFSEPGARLAEDELDYKRALAAGFRKIGTRLLGGEYAGQEGTFLEEFRKLITNQPLASWREIADFFDTALADTQTAARFATRIGSLISAADDPVAVSREIDQFTDLLTESRHG